MLGIDHQHGTFREDEPGADPGVVRSQRRGAVSGAEPAGVVQLGEPDFAPAGLREAETGRQGPGVQSQNSCTMKLFNKAGKETGSEAR